MTDYSAHFRQLTEAQLPDDARILTPPGGPDLIILATWRLASDPNRPSKRSHPPRIVISEEALEDYRAGSHGARLAGDVRFDAWIKGQLLAFDPDHDAPLGVEPPPVTLICGNRDLNGDC